MNRPVGAPGALQQLRGLVIVSGLLALLLGLFPPSLHATEFTARHVGDYGNVTVMQVAGNYDAELPDGSNNGAPREVIAREFYKTHKDEYDFLIIFTDFDFKMPKSEAVAFYLQIKNDVRGIGLELFDYSAGFGSAGKLQGTVDMGNLANNVSDPLDPRFEHTLGTLNHEILHRWGAFLKLRDASGQLGNALLGKDGDHWNYLLDTRGSLHYGSRWQDNGDGTFTAVETRTYFSPLDLYVMGMLDKSEVPPMLLIENADLDQTKIPLVGTTISGTPRTITIEEIIAANGERLPSAAESQKSFKTAFIFATSSGAFSQADLRKLEIVRNGFLTRFSVLTDGQALVQVALAPKEDLPRSLGVEAPALIPRTVAADINEGAFWLAQMQGGDGSWSDAGPTRERDTAESVAALQLFPEQQSAVQAGSEWLATSGAANTDYLARKIASLTKAGRNVTTLVDELVLRQNSDGGWGSAGNFASNSVDTALALDALSAAATDQPQSVAAAVAYLKSRRNTDGGWGNSSVSQVQATAHALQAFTGVRGAYPVEEMIAAASAWLVNRQNPDGGFGNSPSTIYDTAAALLALNASGASNTVVGPAVNYLLARQMPDGSWYQRPYQTAAAIRAVWQSTDAPDLAITTEDIRFFPERVTTLPSQVVVEATVRNLGRLSVPQAKVALYEGEIAETNKIGEQVQAFSGQAETLVTFAVPVTSGNDRHFTIIVDPDRLVDEPNETNNTAMKTLRPEVTYDLVVDGIALSEPVVNLFQSATIEAKVANRGTRDAYDVPVRFFIDQEGADFPIATLLLDLPAGGEASAEVAWQASLAGDLTVAVAVDPFGAFEELSENNNRADRLLTVHAVNRPNLIVSQQELVVEPKVTGIGGAVTIAAKISNKGIATAANVRVDIYIGVPGHGGVVLASEVIPFLAAGQWVQLTNSWSDIQESGSKIVYVVVDPQNGIEEGREDDNEAFTTFTVRSLPDLEITANAIAISPVTAKEGDPVAIRAMLRNRGEMDAAGVLVQLLEGGVILQQQTLASVEGNAFSAVDFIYDTTGLAGSRTIEVVIDPGGQIVEQRKDNNRAEKTFGVQNANLWLTEQYISPNGNGVQDSTTLYFRLEAPQTVQVLVVNEEGKTIRTFGGPELEHIDVAEVVWDGLDDEERVAEDGIYQIQIKTLTGGALGRLPVTVDNNRSPFSKALEAKLILERSFSNIYLNNYVKGWFPDESGLLLQAEATDGSEYGLFKFGTNGEKICINPPEWYEATTPAHDPIETVWSQDGNSLVAVYTPTRKGWGACGWWGWCEKSFAYPSELWIYNAASNDWEMIAKEELDIPYQESSVWNVLSTISSASFSGDGSTISYKRKRSNQVESGNVWDLYVISDKTGKLKVSENIDTAKWAPFDSKIAYKTGGELWVDDFIGSKNIVYQGNIEYFDWMSKDIILVLDNYTNPKLWLVDLITGNNTLLQENVSNYTIAQDLSRAVIFGGDRISVFDQKKREISSITDFPELNGTDFWHFMGTYYTDANKNRWSKDNKKILLKYSNGDIYIFDAESGRIQKFTTDKNYDPIETEYYAYPIIWIDHESVLLPTLHSYDYNNNAYKYQFLYLNTTSGIFKESGLILDWFNDAGISSQNDHIYSALVESSRGNVNFLSSIVNLYTDLELTRFSSGIKIKGTASDLNFGSWRLEYAETNSPDSWRVIPPLGETPLTDDDFTTWLPPKTGTFLVRLTAWDKAGNQKQITKRVTWGETSPIANLYPTTGIFSPNGDGIKDTVEFKYTVLEPVHLEFFLYDANNQLVRRYIRNHPLTGEQSFTWDGTDEQGRVVRDGIYRLKVLDYEQLVEVDNTPPRIDLTSDLVRGESGRFEMGRLFGHADDKNIGSWSISYQDHDGSGGWTNLLQGNSKIGTKPVGSGDLTIGNELLASFDSKNLTTYGGKIFRLTADDRAGNRSTILAGPLEEALVIYSWDLEPLGTDILPAAKTRPGLHTVHAFETIKRSLREIALEYRVGDAWRNAIAEFAVSETGILVSWDTATANGAPNAIRLKIIDQGGAVHYSNILTTQNIFGIGTNCDEPPSGTNYIFEELAKLSFLAQRPDGGWLEYWTIHGDAEPIPTGGFIMPPPDPSLTAAGPVALRAVGVARSGKVYTSNQINWPKDCGKVNFTIKAKGESAACGQTSGSVALTAATSISGSAVIDPQQLAIFRQVPNGWELVRSFGKMLQGSVSIDTSNYTEGAQVFKGVLLYLDQDGSSVEATDLKTFMVDRSLPAAGISYPSSPSQIVCPIKFQGPGGDRFGIPVQGLINDDIEVASYQLFYAHEDKPATWTVAKTWLSNQSLELKGSGSVAGEIGLWDITGLSAGNYTLQLQVEDRAGNVACHQVAFYHRPPVQVATLSVSNSLFSPNGDGRLDSVTIEYALTEAGTATLAVYPLGNQGDGHQIPGSSPVRTIFHKATIAGSNSIAHWDGTDQEGSPVPDGRYAVVLTATGICGTDTQKTVHLEVDNTAPLVAVTAPLPGQSVGSIIEVHGTAQDLHFSNHRLEVGQGSTPEEWRALGTGNAAIMDQVVGTWNRFGLDALWTLRLVAEDKAGNRSEIVVPLDLGEISPLIKDYFIDPPIFSPNGDGRQDDVLVSYELADAGQIDLEFVNAAGQTVARHSKMATEAGSFSYRWDGIETGGIVLPDGDYQARLSVTALENAAIRQEEHLTVTLDTTPPVAMLPQPAEQSFHSATSIAVSGSIDDPHLNAYAVSYAGPRGKTILAEGGQVREDYLFGTLRDLPEGSYHFSVTAKDRAGNVTDISRTFVIDRTPPVVTISEPDGEGFFRKEDSIIQLAGTVQEINLERFSLQVGLGQTPLQWQELVASEVMQEGSFSYVWEFADHEGLADGLYTLQLQAWDKAGHEAETSTLITIDSQAPQVALTNPQDGGYVNTPFEITGTVLDANLTAFQLALSEGECAKANKWVPLREGAAAVTNGMLFAMAILPKDGTYCLRLAASDRSGHEAEVLTGFTIDTRPPAAPRLFGRVENRTDVHLDWIGGGEPDLAGFRIYRDGQILDETSPGDLALVDVGVAAGSYTYQLLAVDLTGNESELSEPVRLKIDTTPPKVGLTSPAADRRVSGLVEIKGRAYSADDFKEYRLLCGAGSEPASWQLLRRSPVPVPNGVLAEWDTLGLEAGAYTLRLEGEDLSGNIAAHEVVCIVDNAPPPAPLLLAAAASGTQVDLSWMESAADDLAGYLVYRSGQVANATGSVLDNYRSHLITADHYVDFNLPDGNYEYVIIAVDEAGNFSEPSNSKSVMIEARAPQVEIVTPANNEKFELKTMIRAESPDNDAASVRFQYRPTAVSEWLDVPDSGLSDPLRTYLDPVALGLIYGQVQVRATATDRAGNTGPASPVVQLTYTDLTAPAVPAGLIARTEGDRVDLHWDPNTEADFTGYHLYRGNGGPMVRIDYGLVSGAEFEEIGLAEGTYSYAVTSVDTYGNESALSEAAMAKVYTPRLFPQEKPIEKSTVNIDGCGVALGASIELFRATVEGTASVGTVLAAPDGCFHLPDLELVDGENLITAIATDAAGNVSKISNVIGVVFSLPPQAPTGLVGTPAGYAVNLSWQQNPEANVIGYLLFRDGARVNQDIHFSGEAVSASSAFSDWWSSYEPWKAVDGQNHSYWMSSRSPTEREPEWIQVDLNGTELISRLEIDWYADHTAPRHFEIEEWNGYGWVSLAKVQENTSSRTTIDFSPALRAGKIRVTVFEAFSPPSYVQIAEISLFTTALLPSPAFIDESRTNREYQYAVAAVNCYGMTSSKSEEISIVVGDIIAPAVPQDLTATADGSSVYLIWGPNNEDDLAGYDIYRKNGDDWIRIAPLVTATNFLDQNLRNGTYVYQITAVDQVGNESERSPEAQAQVDSTLPAVPTGLVVTAGEDGDLNLQWQAGETNQSFLVFRSGTSGGPYKQVNSQPFAQAAYTDSDLISGVRYYYVVAAQDWLGNLSAFSAEAIGIPVDFTPPAVPVITTPIRSGPTLVTAAGYIDLGGTAEAGSLVEVFQNGISIGSVMAAKAMGASQIVPFDLGDERPALSQDGQYIAAGGANQLCIMQRETRKKTCFAQTGGAHSLVWSPDGKNIVFSYYDPVTWSGKLAILNVSTGLASPLTQGAAFERQPSWTRDGKVAFLSSQGRTVDLWLKDTVAGTISWLTPGFYGSNPVISPDGVRIAYKNVTNLFFLSLEDRTMSIIPGDAPIADGSMTWSSDGKKLAYVAIKGEKEEREYQIRIAEVEKHDSRLIFSSPAAIGHLAWSPTDEKILFSTEAYDPISALWNRSIGIVGLDGQPVEAASSGIETIQLVWITEDHFIVLGHTDYFEIQGGGSFRLENVKLYSGINNFYAVAQDASGNQSQPSEPISVLRDTAQLPDLAIFKSDIRIYPPYPLPGENVMISATVRNKGQLAVADADVTIYLWDSTGAFRQVHETTLSSMPPNGEATVSVAMQAPMQFGNNTILVVVDRAGKIMEVSEDNNYAEKEFVVTEKEEITISTRLSANEVTGDQDLRLEVILNNSGQAQDVDFTVQVEDSGGTTVAVLGSTNFELNFGSQSKSFLWNSGSIFAGTYQIRAVLRKGAAKLVEDVQSFVILPDINVDVTVTTSKTIFGGNEEVNIGISLKNAGANNILSNLVVKTSILDEQNLEVYRSARTVISLWPGMQNSLKEEWPTRANPPGEYRVRADIYVDTTAVETASTAFNIAPEAIVSGQLTIDPAVVLAGHQIKVSFALRNDGNVDISGSVQASILEPKSFELLHTEELPVLLLRGVPHTGEMAFSSAGLGLQSYSVALKFIGANVQKTLGSASLTVRDGTPPVITMLSPLAGGIYEAAIPLSVTAVDSHSGIARVQCRIDDGAWLNLPLADPVSGRYYTLWEPAQDGGEYTIRFRAEDHAGNLVESEAINFAVQRDRTPPKTEMGFIGPYRSNEDGSFFIAGQTLLQLTTTDVSVVTRTEYRIDGGSWQTFIEPFRLAGWAEGEHTVCFRSISNAGVEEAEREFRVILDDSPPATRLNLVDRAFFEGETILVAADAQIHLSGSDAISGVEATWYRLDDDDWRLYQGPFTLDGRAYGGHRLDLRSSDRVENMEAGKSTEVVLIGVEAEAALSRPPRVLVWTEAPGDAGSQPRAALEAFFHQALPAPDAFFHLVYERNDFRQELATGNYDVAMIIGQEPPQDAVFIRELRDLVSPGTGLLISGWANNMHPQWQEMLGVDFRGSLPMNESEREALLLPGPLGEGEILPLAGRVIKVNPDDAVIAAIVPAESVCGGVRRLVLEMQLEAEVGDSVSAILQGEKNKKLYLIEEEAAEVSESPSAANGSAGNAAGDLAIEELTTGRVVLSLASPYGYLDEAYHLTLSWKGPDGHVRTWELRLTPTCYAQLWPGSTVGAFTVVDIVEDRVRSGDDLPVAVLHRFGAGSTAFLAFDLMASIERDEPPLARLLGRLANYLQPASGLAGGDVALLEGRLRLHGTRQAGLVRERLGQGLTFQSLFDLETFPDFAFDEREEFAYRYFVRLDSQAAPAKETEVYLFIDGEYPLFKKFMLEPSMKMAPP